MKQTKPIRAWARADGGLIWVSEFCLGDIQNYLDDVSGPVTIIPGHIDFKRVEEIKNNLLAQKHGPYTNSLIRELIQMLTGDKQ